MKARIKIATLRRASLQQFGCLAVSGRVGTCLAISRAGTPEAIMTGKWFLGFMLVLIMTMLSRHPETGAIEGSRLMGELLGLGVLSVLWGIFLRPFLSL